MSVLVTGGAGYIGSHMVELLVRHGHEVVVIDNLLTGHRAFVPPDVPFYDLDVGAGGPVTALLQAHAVSTIFHFASRIQVGESVVEPRRYYTDNLAQTIMLLESALDARVSRFILSSTAAVYGNPEEVPIREHHATQPINPYGETKLAIERMLASYARAYGLQYTALRYFNAAGANTAAGLGERHEPETHLIPLVLEAALGHRPAVTVFGRDYPTPDGTCVRDYIHVSDLVEAHLAAMDYLASGGESGAFNLGSGTGYSVQHVIDTARAVSGRPIPVVDGPRRPGDPAVLVASPERAQRLLGWTPQRSALETIVGDAWHWHAQPHTLRAPSHT